MPVNMESFFSSKAIAFLKRQERDWKITVVRTSLDKFAYQMVFPYLSIYIVALGATVTQLGFVNSLGMIAAGVAGPFTGWFIDRTGPKKIYLIGIGLLAISYLIYGFAHNWLLTIGAMAAYWLGYSVSIHSCSTVCGNSLTNEDRATGMTICETVAAGLLGMAGPMLGAWLVTLYGGVNVDGIRPVFFVSLVITLSTFVIILTQLSNKTGRGRPVEPHGDSPWRPTLHPSGATSRPNAGAFTHPGKKPGWPSAAGATKPHVFRDLHQVMKEGRHLKRWILIATFNQMAPAMVFPFSQVFAHEVKGADQFMLGAMVTGSALASILFAIPLGRMADRVGRKRVLYITLPLFWISNLMLVWSPTPVFLLIAGVLQGFFFIGTPILGAMERELVPPEYMGRWLGITRFFRMLVSACLAFIGGVIWDKIGPQYVFLAFIVVDLFWRAPLIVSMPETLGMRFGIQRLDHPKE
jgi:MFS family permease